MLLCVWLAASYATQFEKNTQTPSVRQPASANADLSTEEEPEKETETIARVR